jgi:uncharacterized protein (TIGR03067 family)
MPRTLTAPAARSRPRTDVELLQGSWTTIAGRRDARLIVAGHRFAFEFLDGDGEIYFGTFKLDSVPNPRRMDMRIDEGPEAYRGQSAWCIYHLDGGILRWCPTKPGVETRLTHFPNVDDDKYLSLVLKRLRPMPRKDEG